MNNSLLVKDKKFYKSLLTLGLPIVLQFFISMTVNMVDNIMVGQFSEYVISACTLSNQFYGIASNIVMGLSNGAAMLIAQYWGKRDLDSVRTLISMMFSMIVVAMVIFAIAMIFFPGAILTLYTNDELIVEQGVKYLRIVGVSFIFHAVSMALTNVLRSIGNARIPMISAIAACLLNVFFNWVFIFGNLGAPRMEIAGAAVGTLIARVIEVGILAFFVLKKDDQLRLRPKDFGLFNKSLFKNYMINGSPILLCDVAVSVGNSVISSIMGHLSVTFVASVSIVTVLMSCSNLFNTGLSVAGGIVIATSVGAGEKDGAYQKGSTLILISLGLGIVGSIFAFLIRNVFIGLYSIDENTTQLALQLVRVYCIIMIFSSLEGMLTKGVLRGGGDTHFLIFGDLFPIWCVAVPLGYVAAFIWGLSPVWLLLCLRIDIPIKVFICLTRFISKKWIRNLTEFTDRKPEVEKNV